jgi:hypothetical protein
LETTRDVKDQQCFFSVPYNYTYSAILEAIIFDGWEGTPGSLEQLRRHKESFIDLCKDQCKLVMQLAQTKSEGRDLSKAEKQSGKNTMPLKEAMRRALAGERIFDE